MFLDEYIFILIWYYKEVHEQFCLKAYKHKIWGKAYVV